MCLYPRKMTNRKYTPTIKNGGCVPTMADERTAEIMIPCGNCIECREQKSREWIVRLTEELKSHKHAYFLTLTFNEHYLKETIEKAGIDAPNIVSAYALRRCLERWRKTHKKSLKHWFVVELGHEGTERVHMHGLIFNNEPLEFQKINDSIYYRWKYWKYGHVYVGDYCTNRTINYITKYITKIDNDHKGFIGQILCSAGMGKRFLERPIANSYKYNGQDTKLHYTLPNGAKINLPTYYKNHLYNEEEREKIWIDSMDKGQIYVRGMQFDENRIDNPTIGNVCDKQREINAFLKYGDDSPEWRKKPYNCTIRRKKVLEEKENGEYYQRKLELRNKMVKKLYPDLEE